MALSSENYPHVHEALYNRGNILMAMGEFEKAEKEFMLSYHSKEGYVFPLCRLAEMFNILGDNEKCEEIFKKALDENTEKQKPYILYYRSLTLQEDDEERSMEDYSRFLLLDGNSENLEHFQSNHYITGGVKKISKSDIKEIIKRIRMKQKMTSEENNNFQEEPRVFRNDLLNDKSIELKELKFLEVEINKCKFEDVDFLRFLGKGSFAYSYECKIKGIPGIFVGKVLKDSVERKDLMMKKDILRIPYHRNLVQILSTPTHSSLFQELNPSQKMPDYEERWKVSYPKPGDSYETPIIFMKYHRKDLGKFLEHHLFQGIRFGDLELMYILRGILSGATHLHNHTIVHRDLHVGNIFVDESMGRIWIGDFGCCLDLSQNKTGFRVRKDDRLLFAGNSSYSSFSRGGCSALAPELKSFDPGKDDFINYEKSDLYSIGLIMDTLVSSFLSDRTTPGNNPKIWVVVHKLMKIDPIERIGYKEVTEDVEDLVKFFEQKLDKDGHN